ncbi:MAG TPA: hypothetical protein VFA88_00660 [Gaiellaceae bacterium]|nr:hypothetical protein [Gaiellaceae bacterium]
MKLARAEEHLAELRTDHHRFLERNPYRALRETDGALDRYLWRVKVVEEPPLDKWAAVIGDFVHALRAALDQTAYALSPTSSTEFPIFKDRGAFEGAYKRKLPRVSDKVLAQVKWLQPYRRDEANDALWIVHELDVIDKHRRLHLVNSALEASGWGIRGGTLADVQPGLGPFKDGAVIGRYRVVPANPTDTQVEVHTHFSFGIAFGEGEPAAGQSVLAMLEVLRVYVGSVIARFERFFPTD